MDIGSPIVLFSRLVRQQMHYAFSGDTFNGELILNDLQLDRPK